MKASTQSRARSDGELFGYFLEVSALLCQSVRALDIFVIIADKSMSVLLGRPICLRDEDCTVHFPKELDDE